MNYFKKNNIIIVVVSLLLVMLACISLFRVDLTSDKRFTLGKPTREMMRRIQEPIRVDVYLNGALNPGFLRLRTSVVALIEEMNALSGGKIIVNFVASDDFSSNEARERFFESMEQRGLSPVAVYEKDKSGKMSQKMLFPWLELSRNERKVAINLLKNNPSMSGEENLNISIENLEFELTDAIRRLTIDKIEKIAFLEGQGELSEAETQDISKSLSRYFQIDRGEIGTQTGVLDEYKAIIIAKPTKQFSEEVKYVLDQYLMQGGAVLWLIDAVQISENQLSETGVSPAMPLDVNLDDMFFRYGVRVNPSLLQDLQCVATPLNVSPPGEKAKFEPFPLVFSPLLLTSMRHPVTRNIPPVMAKFASTIEAVGDNRELKTSVLLAGSANGNVLKTPATISLAEMPDQNDKTYFNQAHVPVALAIEGSFQSIFANRMIPKGIQPTASLQSKSKPTRQIFISDGDVIRNEVQSAGDTIEFLPLGFDRYSKQVYGNTELIVNSVLYLTDKDGWMNLRAREVPLRLLNKEIAVSKRTSLQLINIIMPLVFLLIGVVLFRWMRKRRYGR